MNLIQTPHYTIGMVKNQPKWCYVGTKQLLGVLSCSILTNRNKTTIVLIVKSKTTVVTFIILLMTSLLYLLV